MRMLKNFGWASIVLVAVVALFVASGPAPSVRSQQDDKENANRPKSDKGSKSGKKGSNDNSGNDNSGIDSSGDKAGSAPSPSPSPK